MLVETKGDIPNTFMHAFEDNKRLTNEIEHFQKVTKDYSEVKKIIDENEQLKKVTKDFSEVNKNLNDENEQLKKENAQLRQALSQMTFTG